MAPPVVAKPDFSMVSRSAMADRIQAFLESAEAVGPMAPNLEEAGELNLEELSDEPVLSEDGSVGVLPDSSDGSLSRRGQISSVPEVLLLSRPRKSRSRKPLVVDITDLPPEELCVSSVSTSDDSATSSSERFPHEKDAANVESSPLLTDSIIHNNRLAPETSGAARRRSADESEKATTADPRKDPYGSSNEHTEPGDPYRSEIGESKSDSQSQAETGSLGMFTSDSAPCVKRNVDPHGDIVMTIYGGILEVKGPQDLSNFAGGPH